jgi:tRNA(fMet)-specific endonuclease VapC
MIYLLDSDWVADYLKGREPAVEIVDSLYSAGLSISIITYAEVYEGIYYGHNRPQYERVYQEFLRGVDVLGINQGVARRFAIVRGALRTQGQLISQTDLLIAATALEHGLVMVTRNIRDFGRVPGIQLLEHG